jgi:hypothetical protein
MKHIPLTFVSVALVTLVGCSPSPGPITTAPEGGATTSTAPAGGGTPTAPTGEGGTPTTPTGEGGTPTTPPEEGGTPTTPPGDDTPTALPTDSSGPDFTLFSLPECSVIPGGSLTGADNLTIFVSVRNSGPGSFSRLVPFELRSDTGLVGGGNTTLSTGSSFTAMQVDLKPSDYSRIHRFTITADPANSVVERSESNNSLTIQVSLPSRPSGTTNVTCSVG